MRRTTWMRVLAVALPLALFGVLAAPADAIHFYRGPGGGCTPADGALTDDGSVPPGDAAVAVLHNTFHDKGNATPVTSIAVGESITWEWFSSHCHSVQFTDGPEQPYSGFHYPEAEPDSPALAPGFFHYPVPDLDHTLSFTHTFDTPGTYTYICEHHAAIGMVGTVIVQ